MFFLDPFQQLWYRPPAYGEIQSIIDFETELKAWAPCVIGSVIIGDMNVHHKPWLHYSNGITPEGIALFRMCSRNSIEQLVKTPTRDKYLLDLVLSDIGQLLKVKVLTKLSGHNIVEIEMHVKVQVVPNKKRECWMWKQAKWPELQK